LLINFANRTRKVSARECQRCRRGAVNFFLSYYRVDAAARG